MQLNDQIMIFMNSTEGNQKSKCEQGTLEFQLGIFSSLQG